MILWSILAFIRHIRPSRRSRENFFQKMGDQTGLLLYFEQKGIVAVRRIDLAVGRLDAAQFAGPNDFLRLVSGVEPVGLERDSPGA